MVAGKGRGGGLGASRSDPSISLSVKRAGQPLSCPQTPPSHPVELSRAALDHYPALTISLPSYVFFSIRFTLLHLLPDASLEDEFNNWEAMKL